MDIKWNSDTIEYFKNQNKPGYEGQYIREVRNFVKYDVVAEMGETYEMLVKDLITKTKR